MGYENNLYTEDVEGNQGGENVFEFRDMVEKEKQGETGSVSVGSSSSLVTGRGSKRASKDDSIIDNETNEEDVRNKRTKLAEAGEFDQLAAQVNTELVELGVQEDSAEMIGSLTKIANAGNPEWRVWAGKMLNWTNNMAKFMKGA